MKTSKKLFSLLLFAFICLNSYAYIWDPSVYTVGKKYPGFIIELDGDTVHGFIEANNRCAAGGLGYSNQNRCEFFLNENDKKPKEKYGPEDIAAYMIGDKFYKSIPYSGGLFKKNNFCLEVKKGRITTYEWYATKDGFSTMNKGSNESWEDYDKRRYDIRQVLMNVTQDEAYDWNDLVLGFAKKMSKMTADYPELSEKVKNKDKGYKVLNILEVIEEYNKYWEEQESGTDGK